MTTTSKIIPMRSTAPSSGMGTRKSTWAPWAPKGSADWKRIQRDAAKAAR